MNMKMGKSGCGCMGKMEEENLNNNSASESSEAIEILKNRYAKGEITLQEYQEMKEEILK